MQLTNANERQRARRKRMRVAPVVALDDPRRERAGGRALCLQRSEDAAREPRAGQERGIRRVLLALRAGVLRFEPQVQRRQLREALQHAGPAAAAATAHNGLVRRPAVSTAQRPSLQELGVVLVRGIEAREHKHGGELSRGACDERDVLVLLRLALGGPRAQHTFKVGERCRSTNTPPLSPPPYTAPLARGGQKGGLTLQSPRQDAGRRVIPRERRYGVALSDEGLSFKAERRHKQVPRQLRHVAERHGRLRSAWARDQ